ncbi:transcription factor bHLH126-like [Momordica charantia]|uniref:Transcription factor bHLH126-like n=1 Tax=Momordica charantia TaxID=3673 RepID=A0A6J1DRH4_MOMCH|nr:transcription factor bHLH126-like [Momordica charantia]
MEFNIQSPLSFEVVEELLPLPSLSCVDIAVPQLPAAHNLSDIILSQSPKYGRRRKEPPVFAGDENNKKKKIIHRDVERQRRQEMSTLYAALRALLPPDYLRGKRSICDHMHETVKYIQHMQTKIQELSQKRDELKKHAKQNSDHETTETPSTTRKDTIVVRKKHGGVQVVLDTATTRRRPVSSILEALIAEGLQIASCISTKINDRFLHTIESEAADDSNPSVDVSELHHKLTNLENFPLD